MGALMRKLGVNVDGKAMTALRVVGMYFILIPAAAIFRANDVSHAGMLLSTMLTDFGFSSEYLSAVALCWLALMASDSVSAFQYFQF